MALTLGEARPILWKYQSNVAYTEASDTDTAQFDSTLNRLIQSFFTGDTWKTCFRRVTLRTYGNKLTLPRNLSTCLGVDPICSDSVWSTGYSLRIYSRFAEFATQGPGLTSDCARACSIRGLIPVSDTSQTFDEPTAGSVFTLKTISTVASGRGITLVGGLDENGDIIEGNVKLLVANGTVLGTQQYTEMPFIEKAVTGATVELYAVNVSGGGDSPDEQPGQSRLLGVYAPSETVPSYKRYVIPSAEDGDTFACLCKLGFVPVVQDTDLVVPSIVDALAKGLQSIQFADRNDAERAGLYMGPNYAGDSDSGVRVGTMKGAFDILDSDLAQDEQAEVPLFQMSRDYGCGGIPQLWGWYG